MLLRNTNLMARNNGRTAVARALIPARSVASFVPPGNHMPKPPIEVYPLFVIVAVPLCLATWIMYEKLVNDPGVIVTTPRWQSGFDKKKFPDGVPTRSQTQTTA
ncbi:hypothetical protein FRC19_011793 [Serendipita sp. 401]|nr:hypothetical protein FRC19_011793 [Serendipita sp. 401]